MNNGHLERGAHCISFRETESSLKQHNMIEYCIDCAGRDEYERVLYHIPVGDPGTERGEPAE